MKKIDDEELVEVSGGSDAPVDNAADVDSVGDTDFIVNFQKAADDGGNQDAGSNDG